MGECVLVIGDVHGRLAVLRRLLRSAGVLDTSDGWCGGQATLVLVGDMVDSGEESLPLLDFLMDLQPQAAAAGGQVVALLGNHEVQLLAAKRFGDMQRPSADLDQTFLAYWQKYGGRANDLEQLTARQMRWIESLPIVVRAGDDVMVHANSPGYLGYGDDLDSLNTRARSAFASDDPQQYDELIGVLVGRHAFDDEQGPERLAALVERFGGRRVIHGHSPIARLTGQDPTLVTAPLVYADGQAVNIDHGLYLGGSGFVFDATRSVAIH